MDEASDLINAAIYRIEQQEGNQVEIDTAFEDFRSFLTAEMDNKLESKEVRLDCGKKGKKYKKNKAWWHMGLSSLWSQLCHAERSWIKAKPQDKSKKKADMKAIQRQFQREVQSAKRRHWYNEQEHLLLACEENQVGFWKRIGEVGIAKDRSIPLAVYDNKGNITRDRGLVLDKWKDHFQSLLNVNNQSKQVTQEDLPQYPQPRDVDQLNQPITIAEVNKALWKAKLGKAIGVDGLPVEVLRNPVCTICVLKLVKCLLYGINL